MLEQPGELIEIERKFCAQVERKLSNFFSFLVFHVYGFIFFLATCLSHFTLLVVPAPAFYLQIIFCISPGPPLRFGSVHSLAALVFYLHARFDLPVEQ